MESPSPFPEIPGYRIVRQIGKGGTSFVYLAETADSGCTQVAIKVLKEGLVEEKQRARFTRDYDILSRLKHEHILPVTKFGMCGDRPYIVMDYVRGRSFAEHLKDLPVGPERLRFGLRVLSEAAQGLAHVHAQGVIHRDVKPGNILVRDDGHVFLIDFGLARELDSESKLTSTREVMGTPWYMAPEQLKGDRPKIGAPSDVYALGVCLFETATKHYPFEAESWEELRELATKTEPPKPSELAASVPHSLDAVVLNALEKEPGRRQPSAAHMAHEIAALQAGSPLRGKRTRMAFRRSWRKVLRTRLPLLIVGFILASTGLYFALRGFDKERNTAREFANQNNELAIQAKYAGAEADVASDDFKHALVKLDEAKKLDPRRVETLVRRAIVHAESEHMVEARNDLKEAKSLGLVIDPLGGRRAFDRFMLALSLVIEKKHGAARGVLVALVREDMSDEDRRLVLGSAYFELFRVEKRLDHNKAASEALRQYTTLRPEAGPNRLILEARGLELERNYDDAIGKLLVAVPKIDAGSDTVLQVRAHKLLGRLYQKQRKLDLAAQQYETAEALDGNDPEALIGLAVVRLGQKRPGDAERLANAGLELDPHRVQGHEILSRIYFDDGDHERALEELREAFDVEPNYLPLKPLLREYLRIDCKRALGSSGTDPARDLFAGNLSVDARAFAELSSLGWMAVESARWLEAWIDFP